MWNTSEGDRILNGAEANLFKAGVLALVQCIKEEGELEENGYSIAVFDQLTWSQRLAVLELVTTHLLSESGISPQLSAVNESAIAMVYEYIALQVDLEIGFAESSGSNSWRTLVLYAARECFWNPENEPNPTDDSLDVARLPRNPDSRHRDLWTALVRLLADRILWDRDFELIETFVDEPPEKAAMMRQIMGIGDDYFSTAADDLNSPAEVQDSLRRMSAILIPEGFGPQL
ncbi:MAG: hypothetical protein NXI04_28025 [Planctomycetaceae bacterium]|nr:hypothetical protein [Planctomycetaceae bacterium]